MFLCFLSTFPPFLIGDVEIIEHTEVLAVI